MHPLALLLGGIAAALGLAKLLGHLFDRLQLPPILGQILAGVLLTQLYPPLTETLRAAPFRGLADMGLVLLLLVTGSESSLKEIRMAGKAAILIALGGALVPFGAGYVAAVTLEMNHAQALVVGTLFAPTSIGITAVTLMEAHRLRTTVGSSLIGAAILDDLLVLGLLALALGVGSPAGVAGRAVAFFVLAGLVGWFILPRLFAWSRTAHVPEAPLSLALACGFGLAALAEGMGIAAITGGFLAGLALRDRVGEEKLHDKIHAVSHGLFIPLFFVHLGANLEFGSLSSIWTVAPVLLLASFGGKFIGAAGGGLLARLGSVRALQVGIGMLPRMEVSLVVVALAARRGIFSPDMADLMTGVALLNMVASLLLTPLLLNRAFRLEPEMERMPPHHEM